MSRHVNLFFALAQFGFRPLGGITIDQKFGGSRHVYAKLRFSILGDTMSPNVATQEGDHGRYHYLLIYALNHNFRKYLSDANEFNSNSTTYCQWRIKAFLRSRQDKIFRPSASFFSYTPPPIELTCISFHRFSIKSIYRHPIRKIKIITALVGMSK